MKILLVSAVIIVAAVAGGLILGGFVSEGLFTGLTAAQGSLQDEGADQAAADGSADNGGSSPGFKIKMGSKTGGASDSGSDAGDGGQIDASAASAANNTNSTGNTTTIAFTYSGTNKKKSGDSSSTPEPQPEPPVEEPVKTKIMILPSSVDAALNSTFSVDVVIETEDNVFAATLKVNYDDSALEYVSSEEGGFLSSDGSDTWEIISSGAGYVTYDTTRLKREQDVIAVGASGAGTILSIEFRTRSSGPTEISFGSAELYGDENSDDILFEVFGGSVNVQ